LRLKNLDCAEIITNGWHAKHYARGVSVCLTSVCAA
jgi:hypothetical protein